VAKELVVRDSVFAAAWSYLEQQYDWFVGSWTPKTEPDTEMIALELYGPEISQVIFPRLEKAIPDLHNKLRDLERQLQQLWDDLDPDVVETLIENGYCERCSPRP